MWTQIIKSKGTWVQFFLNLLLVGRAKVSALLMRIISVKPSLVIPDLLLSLSGSEELQKEAEKQGINQNSSNGAHT